LFLSASAAACDRLPLRHIVSNGKDLISLSVSVPYFACNVCSTFFWEILQSNQNATLFDVRTNIEFDYVGHPVGAINIPWQESPDWVIDEDFPEKVEQTLPWLRS